MATLAAVVVTALMMWFLDRFSPYSARNNRNKYGADVRIFTLKECFWFAITQITPEGKWILHKKGILNTMRYNKNTQFLTVNTIQMLCYFWFCRWWSKSKVSIWKGFGGCILAFCSLNGINIYIKPRSFSYC